MDIAKKKHLGYNCLGDSANQRTNAVDVLRNTTQIYDENLNVTGTMTGKPECAVPVKQNPLQTHQNLNP